MLLLIERGLSPKCCLAICHPRASCLQIGCLQNKCISDGGMFLWVLQNLWNNNFAGHMQTAASFCVVTQYQTYRILNFIYIFVQNIYIYLHIVIWYESRLIVSLITGDNSLLKQGLCINDTNSIKLTKVINFTLQGTKCQEIRIFMPTHWEIFLANLLVYSEKCVLCESKNCMKLK